MKRLIPQKIKNIYHLGQAVLANFWYGFPSHRLRVIGVTGTNGKTTTCQMIAGILEEAGKKVAMISTINFKLGGKEWVNDTKYTTHSSFKIQKFIRDALNSNCNYFILETSSHALDQYRAWGVKYDSAVITNVTREHLDYHKTMEEYRKAKSLLFKNLKRNFQSSLNNKKISIVNLDMDDPDYFLNFEADEKYGYTTQNQNAKIKMQNDNAKFKIIKAENIELGMNESKFQVSSFKFQINLPGEFNIENALAATCVGLAEGIKLETIKNALEKIKSVPGRLESVTNGKELNIIIDYAVTPDSLNKLYALIQQINTKKTKVIAVFGSCGERDRGKRPIMGEIVARNADYVIVTNEDPYGEDPIQIINEVTKGIKNKKEGENFWKILDRREAIKKALRLAKPGDFVIVTGKGAEETMAVGKKRLPWNDKQIILEELEKL